MLLTWAVGITAKLTVPASILSQSMIESISGCVLPVLILACMEVWSKYKGLEDRGYDAICKYTDPDADKEPDEPKTLAVKNIVLSFVLSIFALIAVYVVYRLIDSRKQKPVESK